MLHDRKLQTPITNTLSTPPILLLDGKDVCISESPTKTLVYVKQDGNARLTEDNVMAVKKKKRVNRTTLRGFLKSKKNKVVKRKSLKLFLLEKIALNEISKKNTFTEYSIRNELHSINQKKLACR